MRTHVNEDYDSNGLVSRSVVPWTQQDYLNAIEWVEQSITQRMRDEAILGTSTLLAEKRAEIDALRDEMRKAV
jgi:hypothetical protein